MQGINRAIVGELAPPLLRRPFEPTSTLGYVVPIHEFCFYEAFFKGT
jgi:hypothetical protein